MASNAQTNSVKPANALEATGWDVSRLARRIVPSCIVLFAWFVLKTVRNWSEARMQNEAFVTGYSLAAICVLLLLLGLRKRIVSIHFGRLAVWQQTHHYLGLMSVGAYALHAGFPTTGWMESILAVNFWFIAMSGLISWYVNRTSPSMLRAAGHQILRQDIASRATLIAKKAYDLALVSAGKNDTAALADHYRVGLSSFFGKRRSVFYQISPTGRPRRKLLAGLENIDRYLSEEGRSQRAKMSDLVQARDDLDFQSAVQNRLRFWAAAHTWLLGCFLVLTIAHIVIAHQFTSSW